MFELLMVCDTGGCCLHLLRYIGWKLEKQKPSLWLGILHTLQRNRAPVKYVIERFFARHDLPIVYLLLFRFIIFSTRAVDHSKRKQSYLERRGRRWLRKFNGRRKSIFVLKKKMMLKYQFTVVVRFNVRVAGDQFWNSKGRDELGKFCSVNQGEPLTIAHNRIVCWTYGLVDADDSFLLY